MKKEFDWIELDVDEIIYEEEYTDAETSINNKDAASDINDFEESEDNYENDFEEYDEDELYEEDFETDHDVIEEDLDQKAGKQQLEPLGLGKSNKKSQASGVKRKKKKKTSGKKTAKKGTSKKNNEVAAAGIIDKIKEHFHDFGPIDAIVGVTGIFVLVVAIVTLNLWGDSKTAEKQVSSMAELGQQLSGIEIIGESGLLAIADAKMAAETVAEEPMAEEIIEQDESEIEVKVNMTSVEKDLKIKFVNKETGKLISGTEFEVELTDPKKKTSTKTDDDKDGIIYLKDITPGKYSVLIKPVGEFTFPTEPVSVTVKDKIAYEKIEIADEVKTEKEVNAAKEDTAVEVVQESAPVDTVEWVESTKTSVSGGDGYEAVDKSKITDPSTTSSAWFFTKFVSENEIAGVTLDKSELNLEVNKTGSLSATISYNNDGASGASIVWSSSDSAVATVDGGTVTAKAAGTATITATVEGTTKTATCSVIVKEATPETIVVTKVTLDKTTATVAVESTVSLVATVEPTNATDKTVTWTSSDTAVATVGTDGKVTGVKAGTATITVKTKDGDKTETCVVTVTAKLVPSTAIALSPATQTIAIGKTQQLSATLTPSTSTDTITWSSSDSAVATVSDKGLVTAVKAGTATITATTTSGIKATSTITVSSTLAVTLDKTTVTIKKGATTTLTPTPSGFTATKPTYTWASSHTDIATVGTDGKVTAVKAGTATITLTATDTDKRTATATCTITVTTAAADDKTTKLKDNSGNQLYVKENNAYREAVYADYFTAGAFFKKVTVTYKYTGWQTIDNVTYFFNKNGDKVTGEQVIKGVKYNFGSNGALSMGSGALGIDVSKWNGDINWTAVKNSGVSYVIIRCGYRGSSTGALIQDPKFYANIKGASAAGLKVGIYFFTQAVNEVEAVEEASMTLNMIKGYNISYPIFIDTEGSGGRADGIDKGTRTAVCNAFCATIQNAGYKAGIYASKSWFDGKLNTSALSSYKIWLAQYATKPTYGGRYDMWQYTSNGAIGGIKGNVDLNTSYLGY
ncbi:MAG: Ig-like domain-containing protein [Lachnospiraceae bacterium]|nr:Ig-like domain-containing protein [Lachnospiraceae bacterium]